MSCQMSKLNRKNIDIMTAFFQELEKISKIDKNVFFITADHGAWALAKFKKNLKKQYMNIGISEQHMISFAAGMALNKKKVFLFTITPFITQRCLEQIKVDLCFPNLPVTIIGNGSSLTYAYHGTSHQAIEDIPIMRSLPNLKILNPCDNLSASFSVKEAYKSKQPVYIKLDKGFFPDIYSKKSQIKKGINSIDCNFIQNDKLIIFTTGNVIEQAKVIKKNLIEKGISSEIIDVYRIKPINKKEIIKILEKSKCVVSIEEQLLDGGIGSILCEIIADNKINIPIKRFGINDKYSQSYGDRNWLRKIYKIDTDYVFKNILSWYSKFNEKI